MALAYQLQAVRLNKTQHVEKASSSIPSICRSEEDYQLLMTETYFERYWEQIRPFTFRSTFVPLPLEAAGALVQAHQQWKATPHHQQDQWKDNLPVLATLTKSIDAAMRSLGVDQAFVRLSSRSPKDAALSRPGFRALLEAELQKVKEAGGNRSTSLINQQLHALYRASTVALKVSSGEEGVQLLVESPRIQCDLEEVVKEKKSDFNVVVRAWGDFDVDLEFRAFIFNRKLAAVTQYNEFNILSFL